MEVSGKTKVFCVIGDPIEHSLSPMMHNAAFRHSKIDAVYVAFKVEKGTLEDAVKGMHSFGICGMNVTTPHKTAIIKYLDGVDTVAEFVGAVNTVLNANGKLLGFNTDGIGALRALEENGVKTKGKRVLLLGAGGAGRAIAFQLAQEADELIILNRDANKARVLAGALRKRFNKRVVGNDLTPNVLKNWIEDVDVLINATSVGMHPHRDHTLVDKSLLKPELTVMDIVYNPVKTKLLKDAKSVGAKVIYGVEMLVYQGAASFEIWFNQSAPVEVMKEAVLEKLQAGGLSLEQ
ncbi:shikimate dehydrogenase [Candidatus Bathyarchaeota archaeon]|nr:shikimate dehydrogenase [Candidatus Bathyarchaeota archaeon]